MMLMMLLMLIVDETICNQLDTYMLSSECIETLLCLWRKEFWLQKQLRGILNFQYAFSMYYRSFYFVCIHVSLGFFLLL